MQNVQNSTSAHPTYRPDIDGLRAVAVLAVVVFHAFPDWLPGGFVGVDIFFVISGFLISTILFNGLEQGSFSFGDFYARRVRRIFPALVIVLGACLALGWGILLTDEYSSLGESVLGGASFLANFQLWQQAGYFDTKAELKPLLHLWSLGIEEQFYMVWPLLLWLGYRLRANLPLVTLLVLGASFFLNIDTVHLDRTRTFYLPDTRFWELLSGSLLAYVTLHHGRLKMPRALSELLSVAGIGLLVAAVVLVRAEDYFPGWWALLPIGGAVLSIAAGPGAWLNRRALGSLPMRKIGLISFQLYLWHWPLLVFARLVYGDTPSDAVRAGAVALSFGLAILTVAVEKPLRFGAFPRMKVAGLCTAMVALAGTGYLISEQRLVPYSKSAGLEKIMAAAGEWDFPSKEMKQVEFQKKVLFVSDSGSPETTLFLGDSNMEQYGPRINQLVSQQSGKVNTAVFATAPGCPPIPNVTDKDHPQCGPSLRTSLEYAARPEVTTVVIGALWDVYYVMGNFYQYEAGGKSERLAPRSLGTKQSMDSLAAMIAGLVKSGKKVYLVLTIPNGQKVDPKFMVKRSLYPIGFNVDRDGLPVGYYLHSWYNQVGNLRAQLIDAGRRGGATIVDPLEHLCDKQTCPSVTATGEPIYKDSGHLRPSFVRDHVLYLDETLGAG